MNSQLPQNLRTSKFDSLPDDARQLAEELICEKFDVAEVVDGGRKDNDFFDPSVIDNNIIRGELVSRSGHRLSFMTQVSPGINWDSRASYSNGSSGNSTLSSMAMYVEEVIRKYIRKFEEQCRDYVDHIRLEMNGYSQVIRSFNDIQDLIHKSYRNENYNRGYRSTMRSNWTYL